MKEMFNYLMKGLLLLFISSGTAHQIFIYGVNLCFGSRTSYLKVGTREHDEIIINNLC